MSLCQADRTWVTAAGRDQIKRRDEVLHYAQRGFSDCMYAVIEMLDIAIARLTLS